jgi:hypothetical protein
LIVFLANELFVSLKKIIEESKKSKKIPEVAICVKRNTLEDKRDEMEKEFQDIHHQLEILFKKKTN